MTPWKSRASPWSSAPGAPSVTPSTPASSVPSATNWDGMPVAPISLVGTSAGSLVAALLARRPARRRPRPPGPAAKRSRPRERPSWAARRTRPCPPPRPTPISHRCDGIAESSCTRCPGTVGGSAGLARSRRCCPPDASRRIRSRRRSRRCTATGGRRGRCGSWPSTSTPDDARCSVGPVRHRPRRRRQCRRRARSRPTSSPSRSAPPATSTAECTRRRMPTSSPTKTRTWS